MEPTVLGIYCERTGPGLLAEPLNAVSNASFIDRTEIRMLVPNEV